MSEGSGALAGWTAVVAGMAAVIWWLLATDQAAGPWVLAAFVLGHGLVHLLFAVPPPAGEGEGAWPFDMTRSWAGAGSEAARGLVRGIGWILVAATILAAVLGALATVDVAVPTAWWGPAVAGSAVASATTLVLFFSPQFALGIAIDAGLIWVAVSGAWVP